MPPQRKSASSARSASDTSKMELTNFQDRSKLGANTGAGFQFEFFCSNCSRRWKSPFKPYRKGQFTGLLFKFAYLISGAGRITRLSGAVSESGEKGAKLSALEEAQGLAASRYSECPDCTKIVCDECWSDRAGRCTKCDGGGRQHADSNRSAGVLENDNRSVTTEAIATPSCPNCQTSLSGGRFCAECGFDMASTHKSCPGCGTMCARSTRFCGDCGYGF